MLKEWNPFSSTRRRARQAHKAGTFGFEIDPQAAGDRWTVRRGQGHSDAWLLWGLWKGEPVVAAKAVVPDQFWFSAKGKQVAAEG